MGLHVNLMMDEGFRKEALGLIREQLRPTVREELQKMIAEEFVRDELQKLMAEMPEKVAKKIRYDVQHFLRYDRELHETITKAAVESLQAKLKQVSTSEIEQVVRSVLRSKLGSI